MWRSVEKRNQAALIWMIFQGDKNLVNSLTESNNVKENHVFDWVGGYGQDADNSKWVYGCTPKIRKKMGVKC